MRRAVGDVDDVMVVLDVGVGLLGHERRVHDDGDPDRVVRGGEEGLAHGIEQLGLDELLVEGRSDSDPSQLVVEADQPGGAQLASVQRGQVTRHRGYCRRPGQSQPAASILLCRTDH